LWLENAGREPPVQSGQIATEGMAETARCKRVPGRCGKLLRRVVQQQLQQSTRQYDNTTRPDGLRASRMMTTSMCSPMALSSAASSRSTLRQ
jgi:hypothetical protein